MKTNDKQLYDGWLNGVTERHDAIPIPMKGSSPHARGS